MAASYIVPDLPLFEKALFPGSDGQPCIVRFEEEIKRSRFITTLARADNRERALALVEAVRNEFPDARHHCWAYAAGRPGDTAQVGQSDDGEPHGTAGRPMLNQLLYGGVGEVAAVTTRYFGGIKLGANGLVGAYSRSVAEALDRTEIVTYTPTVIAQVEIDYAPYGKLTNKIIELGAEEIDKDFFQGVKVTYAVREEKYEQFIKNVAAITSGSGKITEIERKHYIFK